MKTKVYLLSIVVLALSACGDHDKKIRSNQAQIMNNQIVLEKKLMELKNVIADIDCDCNCY